MRIATWNVNSIRSRVGRVVDWLVREDIDVLAHAGDQVHGGAVPVRGVRGGRLRGRCCTASTSGTASRSRAGIPMDGCRDRLPRAARLPARATRAPTCRIEARAIGVTVDGVRLWSLYVPNGRALDDPHYAYKLDWLAHAAPRDTRDWLAAEPDAAARADGRLQHRAARHRRRGPDVRRRASRPTSRRPSATAFAAFETAGLTDVVRPLVPEGYTYWDYKQLRFPRNEGMRIDFILGIARLRRSRHRRAASTATSARATPRATTCRWSSTSTSSTEDDDDRPMIF